MNKSTTLNLSDLVAQITSKIRVEEIYHWLYQRDGKRYNMLQVHVNRCDEKTICIARRHCASLEKELSSVQIIACVTKDVETKIEQGSAKSSLICQQQNLIYQHPEVQTSIKAAPLEANQLIESHAAYLREEIEKIKSFEDGYYFYAHGKQPKQAAFMLHQMIELTLRLAQDLLIGKEKRTHSLRELQKELKCYDSILGALFTKGNLDQITLNKLDEAYSTVRYEQGFTIDAQHLEKGHEIAKIALGWVDTYREEMNKDITESLSLKRLIDQKIEIMKNGIETVGLAVSDHKETIVEFIKLHGDIASIHCFSYKYKKEQSSNLLHIEQSLKEFHHYYLLVGYQTLHVAQTELQQHLHNLLPDNIRLTLIVESRAQMQQQVFYKKTIQIAESCYTNEALSQYKWKNRTNVLSDEKTLAQWQKQHDKATTLCLPYINGLTSQNEEVACFTAALALELACIGLLRKYWQYTPKRHNLNFLMDLCDLICPEATEVFIRENKEQNRIFKLLTKTQQNFRYNKTSATRTVYTEKLINQVVQFIEIANNHVMAFVEKAA